MAKFDICKIFTAMISYKSFSYFEALGAIIREIEGLLSMMTPLDLEAGVKGQFGTC